MTDGEDESGEAMRDRRDGDLLLYDYFKHLTSLSILTLGGVLVVSESANPQDVKPIVVIAVLVMVALSAVLAFSGTSEIVTARTTGQSSSKAIGFYRAASPALLALGVGMFLYMFSDSLS